MVDEGLFDLRLASWVCRAEEVEEVPVLEDLARQIRLGRWERLTEVVDGLPLSGVSAVVDLEGEDVARPAVRDGLLSVPAPLRSVVKTLEQCDVLAPR